MRSCSTRIPVNPLAQTARIHDTRRFSGAIHHCSNAHQPYAGAWNVSGLVRSDQSLCSSSTSRLTWWFFSFRILSSPNLGFYFQLVCRRSHIQYDDDQLPESLESLHLLRVKAWHTPDYSMTPLHFLDTANHISHLSHLTTLTATLGTYLKADDIRVVAELFPRLRWLHLGQYIYSRDYETPLVDRHADSYMVALQRFQHLDHLRISLNILLGYYERGIPAHAAFRILQEVPRLKSVSFRWYYSGDASPEWYTWDRSLLSLPCPPPLPLPEEETVDWPRVELVLENASVSY
ncbi:hypothetical protein C8F01DRAFT_649845 [Mycena amicta]|nr:hypothetical protein C8F01DRAFT_649845 [Mycena amicta]